MFGTLRRAGAPVVFASCFSSPITTGALELAWHRRARIDRARVLTLLAVSNAVGFVSRHHGSSTSLRVWRSIVGGNQVLVTPEPTPEPMPTGSTTTPGPNLQRLRPKALLIGNVLGGRSGFF